MAQGCLPSDFSAAFLLSIGDAVRELGRPIRGELRRATAVAMSRYVNKIAMTQRKTLAGRSGVVIAWPWPLFRIEKAGTRRKEKLGNLQRTSIFQMWVKSDGWGPGK